MYMSTFLNMDLTLMRPLRLDDIFVGDFQEALTDLIWNQLMADNKVTTHEALEDMGYACLLYTSREETSSEEHHYRNSKQHLYLVRVWHMH